MPRCSSSFGMPYGDLLTCLQTPSHGGASSCFHVTEWPAALLRVRPDSGP